MTKTFDVSNWLTSQRIFAMAKSSTSMYAEFLLSFVVINSASWQLALFISAIIGSSIFFVDEWVCYWLLFVFFLKIGANQPMDVEVVTPCSPGVRREPISESNHNFFLDDIPDMNLQLRKMAINGQQPTESQASLPISEAFSQYFESSSMLVNCCCSSSFCYEDCKCQLATLPF